MISKLNLSIIVMLISSVFVLSCHNDNSDLIEFYDMKNVPSKIPVQYKQELVPEDQLIHKGIFNPKMNEYYFTVSNKSFSQFDVLSIQRNKNGWTSPQKAFFNSVYNDHGMSFSPDGKSILFSSTRPTGKADVSNTWHIWKSDFNNGQWCEPYYLDIPNLRDKLVSHPSITANGTLYFHSSNLDYSDMHIYTSQKINGMYQNAERIKIHQIDRLNTCTPYISKNEDFLLFMTIGEINEIVLSRKDKSNSWSSPATLNLNIDEEIQGNPWLSPDHKFLFFTSSDTSHHWSINWVDFSKIEMHY